MMNREGPDLWILVMGVSGSGKTSFISKCCPEAETDIGNALQSRMWLSETTSPFNPRMSFSFCISSGFPGESSGSIKGLDGQPS